MATEEKSEKKTESKKSVETSVSEDNKKCFIITPIGDENSDIRRKTEGLFEAIIKPVMSELGYEAILPQQISNPGSITTQVIDRIISSDLVIANLTGLNPNVMYELAVRHAARKPIVCVVENGTKLPFDIQQDRVIFYNDEFCRVETLKKDLRQMVESAVKMKTKDIDNPIYRSLHNKVIMEQLSSSEKKDQNVDITRALVEKLNRIEDQINSNSRYNPRRTTERPYQYLIVNIIDNPDNINLTEIASSLDMYLTERGYKVDVTPSRVSERIRIRFFELPLPSEEMALRLEHYIENSFKSLRVFILKDRM